MKGQLKKASENPLAAAIREGIGAGPDEEVQVVTSQLDREPGDPAPPCVPKDLEGFLALRKLSVQALKEMGMRRWNEILWVYPAEWYNSIPAGLGIVDIFGEEERFVPGVTDNGRRVGTLAYGFIRDEDLPRFAKRLAEDWD